MNRFELLYKTNPILFNAFVLKGPQLWKPLTDMQISLDVDNKQLKENVKKRQIALKKWYDNFAINFNRVLDEIEERNPHVWTKPERKTIFNRYLKSQRIYEAYR
jgi:hypothetical protein